MGACIGAYTEPGNGLSSGFSRSLIEVIPFLLFLLLVDIFLFLVCIPSFFIVRGRFTCKPKKDKMQTINKLEKKKN